MRQEHHAISNEWGRLIAAGMHGDSPLQTESAHRSRVYRGKRAVPMAIEGASPIEPIAVIGLIQFRGTNRAKIGHGFGGILTCVTRKVHDAPSA